MAEKCENPEKSGKIRNRISGYLNSGGPFLSPGDHPCQILAPWDVHCGRESRTNMVSDRDLELAIIYKDNNCQANYQKIPKYILPETRTAKFLLQA